MQNYPWVKWKGAILASHVNQIVRHHQSNKRTKTLSAIYHSLVPKHGRIPIDYLKVDIDLDEWAVLPEIIQSKMLDNIRQMGIEIHLKDSGRSLNEYREAVKILSTLENQGMVRFDSKCNPATFSYFSQLGVKGCLAYEISWYNNKFFKKVSIHGVV